jgi:hypothetical protein
MTQRESIVSNLDQLKQKLIPKENAKRKEKKAERAFG